MEKLANQVYQVNTAAVSKLATGKKEEILETLKALGISDGDAQLLVTARENDVDAIQLLKEKLIAGIDQLLGKKTESDLGVAMLFKNNLVIPKKTLDQIQPPLSDSVEFNTVFFMPVSAEYSVFGYEPTDKDLEILKKVFDQIKEKTAGLKRPIVYIGIGTGNPSSGWGNPSLSSDTSKSENLLAQTEPNFLTNIEPPYDGIIIINFNVDGAKELESVKPMRPNLQKDNVFKFNIALKFPICAASKKTMELAGKIAALKGEFGASVIMNAVTDTHYQSICSMAVGSKSTYINSYLQKGIGLTVVKPIRSPKMMGFTTTQSIDLTNNNPKNFIL